ncbi:microsomal signal peptidase [Hysterangium stoloniferum]|nr:microsomal signal peptidase [Hysterangium stoloniferum]
MAFASPRRFNCLVTLIFLNKDFEGQKLADVITRYALISATIISFLVGVVMQSLMATFGTFACALVVLALVVVPPWPLFNRHSVQWLPKSSETKKSK